MNQLSLPFSEPTTSKNAALDTGVRKRAASQRAKVLEYVTRHPSTCDEIQAALGLSFNCLHPRLWQLVKDGLLVMTTQTRPTRTGQQARVYERRWNAIS